MKEDNMNTVH